MDQPRTNEIKHIGGKNLYQTLNRSQQFLANGVNAINQRLDRYQMNIDSVVEQNLEKMHGKDAVKWYRNDVGQNIPAKLVSFLVIVFMLGIIAFVQSTWNQSMPEIEEGPLNESYNQVQDNSNAGYRLFGIAPILVATGAIISIILGALYVVM
ncbi:MAG: hypothetical protein ACOC5T_05420 [Elusimicrobiota bacterium]